MNIKLKMTFVIIATFILGIIIGAMLNRALVQKRIRNILSKRTPDVFVPFIEERIGADPVQSKEIRKVLNKHAKRIEDIRANFSVELQSAFESLRAEMDPLLTPEQKKRLERGLPGPLPMGPPRFLITEDLDGELRAMKEALGLTEEQTLQIRQILEEMRDQFRKVREEMDRAREKWRPMLESEEKADQAIREILTDEQKKLYDKYKEERHKRFERGMFPPPRRRMD